MTTCIACEGFPSDHNNPCGLCGTIAKTKEDEIELDDIFNVLNDTFNHNLVEFLKKYIDSKQDEIKRLRKAITEEKNNKG